ncbi:unnamed protein product [Chilo suppressalis]|uniref:VWFC domain-containing protein n=1 Tax=Chilo suppressalis TaxID=168631 RepID=A0ABN8EES7_CHISP|nr:unnamed protein product [Chilo suppressalis]
MSLAALASLALLFVARADLQRGLVTPNNRAVRVLELPQGCMYEGRWHTQGSAVATREACLKCACARGALSCRRRACTALPDPPPRRCHVLHKKGACCPELHCPDGVKVMEHGAVARFENDDFTDIATPASITHACVSGGTVFAAGSAMGSRVACEQCFCLGGAKRCVRPRCLPPPPGCRARPAPGACCPQRYYCDRVSTKPPDHKHVHDCQVNGDRIAEGERVVSAEKAVNCTQCFCLRGAIRCQPLACAPPLLGCQPLLSPGQCCPHQYHCEHAHHALVTKHIMPISDNNLLSTRYDDRAFHDDKLVEQETTTKLMTTSSSTTKNIATITASNNEPITTTKVKRKTNDPPPLSTSKQPNLNATKTTTKKDLSTTTTTKKLVVTTTTEVTPTTETLDKTFPTEQPEKTVKIIINGTINCTAALSSTSIPLNISLNDTDRTKIETHQRTPINRVDIEAFTEYPNDIITDRSANGDFDENDMFIINVTSSLRTNNSHSTAGPSLSTTPKSATPIDVVGIVNTSKKSKGDYDYDYTEPTLPPSLPNLKIIPFVAADAVVDDDVSSKDKTLTYPILEREDKFPVYYPSVDTKEVPYANRRKDVGYPTQYPVFVSQKAEAPKYPSITQEVDLPDVSYSESHNNVPLSQHDYTVSTAIGNNIPEINKVVTKLPTTRPTLSVETPSVNLFSPPIETEGGFIPKGPGIIDEYYAVYPSTPPGPPVPHLTTSMQLDIAKGDCVSGDGRRVLEGDSISLACSICSCAWGELHCSPRPCHIPHGCIRRPASSSSVDLCCGELICEQGNKTTQKPNLLINIQANETKPQMINKTSSSGQVLQSKVNNTLDNSTISNNRETLESNSWKTTTESNSWNVSTTKVNATTPTSKPLVSTEVVSTTQSSTIITTIDYSEEEEESDEEEDEGFSFGSVLKLLLSDSYESTTIPPQKNKPSTFMPKPPNTTTSTTTPTTTKLPPAKPPLVPFIPMPHPYMPPKKSYTQNTVNRIDHLVLGEATAIKKTTLRPVTAPFRPIVTFKPVIKHTTNQRPYMSTRVTEATKKEEVTTYRSVVETARPASSLPLPGILKLAGCNIYGRMYRVGRIITELSTPCQECWCTELGVQCNSLKC